jgi:CRP-like cAMP-binding protein
MPDAPVDFRLLAGAGAPARDFKAGEVIFREGDPAHELFIIQSGEIEVRLGNRVLETLSQYSIFGEMALIDSSPPQCNGRRRHRYEARFREREAISVSRQQHALFRAQPHAHHGAPPAPGEPGSLVAAHLGSHSPTRTRR